LNTAAAAESDVILRDLQAVMFAYDIGILKHADRLAQAMQRVERLADRFKGLAAPHTHELVRLKETEAMLLAARFILGASTFRTESRLSHFRDDFPQRDDDNWLEWVDVSAAGEDVRFERTPIPTPLCPVLPRAVRPTRLQRFAVARS